MFYTSTNSFVPRMKTGVFALAAIVAFTAPALADDNRSICLRTQDVDHTKVLNDHQVLFYMRGKKVWLNTLQSHCVTLPNEAGFVWSSAFEEFCGGAETIRVVRTGEVCRLGQFSPYEQPVNHS